MVQNPWLVFPQFCAFLTNYFAQSAHNFKIVFLIERTTLRQIFMMHHAIAIEVKKSEQNLHIWPNSMCLIKQFWTNLHCHTFHAENIGKNCLACAERYANIISSLSNIDSMIIHNHFLHCCNVFIGCWCARATRTSIVIDIFQACLKPFMPQLNLCSAYSRLTKCHSLYFKDACTFNFIFYTKI